MEEAPADEHVAVWIFGYGSLVWRPAFEHVASHWAVLPASAGFIRRFWQGSPDHRGTPERPGRVITILPAGGSGGEEIWGRVYGVSEQHREQVLEYLDLREQGGYDRQLVQVKVHHPRDEPSHIVRVVDVRNSSSLLI
jgi:glutathione-specific gamma-glutamylcyclotransferase